MRFGVTLPNLGVAGGPSALVDLAVVAEESGWDGIFFWDTFGSEQYDQLFPDDAVRRAPWDAWSLLAAVAVRTERVRIGTVVTPVGRRRPWKLAAEAATVDRLSGGRLVLSVGLGWPPDAAFSRAGEATDRTVRAQRLDEGLGLLESLWSSPWTSVAGEHYSVESFPGLPPVSGWRIPVWVVGAWPRRRSMERALRFDGLLPAVAREIEGRTAWVQPSADELAPIAADLRARIDDGFELIAEGHTSRDPDRAAETVAPFASAGATWWLEGVWGLLHHPEARADPTTRMIERIQAGPPPLPG